MEELQSYAFSYTAQPSITIGFSEIDYRVAESEGNINVTVQTGGDSINANLSLIITPFTFEEYASQIGKNLPNKLQTRAQNLDRAECT